MHELCQEIHEHARSNEDEQQACNETVDTCCLSDSAAEKHGRCNIAFALRLTSDSFQSLRNGITFTNTRANARDQRAACTNSTSSQCDTFCK